MKILLLAPAPRNISPSQRFRFEHYIIPDNNNDLKFIYKSFLGTSSWGVLHLNNHHLQKGVGICWGFLKRFLLLFTIHQYDWVYIHREASPIGPPIFEWLIAKVWRKKIIFDFDDAIWLRLSSEANPLWPGLKCSWKVKNICNYSHTVTVGNKFLASYAQQYCKNVKIIPTVVDTACSHNKLKDHSEEPLYIGWTGTFTNFPNLRKIIPVINKLLVKYNFNFLIIADRDPQFSDVDYQYIQWNIKTEIQDLLQLHIGLMPLANTERELGKCAFKAIQYMSLGISAVVSPVGANCDVVQDEINGFWANNEEEWYAKIETLILDRTLRMQTGISSRKSIIERYSVLATSSSFLSLFKQ